MANNLEQYRILETISEKIYQMTENIEACTLDSGSFEIGEAKIEEWDFGLNVENIYEGKIVFDQAEEGFINIKISNQDFTRKLGMAINKDFKIHIKKSENSIYISNMFGYALGYNFILGDEIQYQKTLAYLCLMAVKRNDCDMCPKIDGIQVVKTEKCKEKESFDTKTETSNYYAKLNDLVGLESIKEDVNNLVNLMKMQIRRKEQGLKTVPVSLHLVFSGNPGTGKTTIARILAGIYKDIGILSKGQLVEVDRAGLVAGYVGQTAIKTQEKIDEALGGILFIDEAYTLVKDGSDYGQEAIDTILKAMEDHRDDFIVIVAGYSDLMEKFINSNPGLKSRFNKYVYFPDYTATEMIQIFKSMCKEYAYELDKNAENVMEDRIYTIEKNKGANFANARDVRNLFERVITNQATRLAYNNSENIMEIKEEDFL